MLRISLCILALSFAALSRGAEPVVDNDRVTVWDTASALPPAQHDFVAVSLTQKGTAVFGRRGAIPCKDGVRTVVVELKDNSPTPIPNNTAYPPAFPRPHAKRLLENDRVVVWNSVWRPGKPTPMHFHDKDVVIVYMEDSAITSTTPDGTATVSEYKFGQTKFNPRERIHFELLAHGTGSAVMTELK